METHQTSHLSMVWCGARGMECPSLLPLRDDHSGVIGKIKNDCPVERTDPALIYEPIAQALRSQAGMTPRRRRIARRVRQARVDRLRTNVVPGILVGSSRRIRHQLLFGGRLRVGRTRIPSEQEVHCFLLSRSEAI